MYTKLFFLVPIFCLILASCSETEPVPNLSKEAIVDGDGTVFTSDGDTLELDVSDLKDTADSAKGTKETLLRNTSEEDLVEALSSMILEDFSSVEEPLLVEESVCAAESIVDSVGYERLSEVGVTPDNIPDLETVGLSLDEQIIIMQVSVDCSDHLGMLMLGFYSGDEETRNCLMDQTSKEELKILSTNDLRGETDFEHEAVLLNKLNSCLSNQ